MGEGLTALEAASQLVAFGYEVLLAYPEEEFQAVRSLLPEDREMSCHARELSEGLGNQEKIALFAETRIKSITGFAGDFEVRLQSPQKEWKEQVGAVLLAPELVSTETSYSDPLSPSRQIIPLGHLVEELIAPSRLFPGTSFVDLRFLRGLSDRTERRRGNGRHGPGLGVGGHSPGKIWGSGLFFYRQRQGGRGGTGTALPGRP